MNNATTGAETKKVWSKEGKAWSSGFSLVLLARNEHHYQQQAEAGLHLPRTSEFKQ
jgi:hypothetical protein